MSVEDAECFSGLLGEVGRELGLELGEVGLEEDCSEMEAAGAVLGLPRAAVLGLGEVVLTEGSGGGGGSFEIMLETAATFEAKFLDGGDMVRVSAST